MYGIFTYIGIILNYFRGQCRYINIPYMDPLGLHVSFHWTAWKLETSPFCCPAPTDAPSLGDHWLYLALVKRACDQQAIPTFNDLQGHVTRNLCSWHVYRFCNKKLGVAIAWVFALKRVVGWGHQCREDSIGGRQHPHQSALEYLGKRSTPSTTESKSRLSIYLLFRHRPRR